MMDYQDTPVDMTETTLERSTEPNDTISQKVAKLIDVKSIITMLLTVGFIYMSVAADSVPESYIDIYKMIVVFYFGYQSAKK